MIDFEVAFDKLASMESAQDIADYFRYEGIKAEPCEARKCAITVWMEGQTGKNISTSKQTVSIVVTDPVDNTFFTTEIQRWLTEAMRDFVNKFDNYIYPDLTLNGPPDLDDYNWEQQ